MAIGFSAIVPTLSPKLTQGQIERHVQDWAGRTHKRIATYPMQRPTKYRRTGTLGRGWIHYYGREGNALVAVVTNGVRYAGWVQDEHRQTAVMRSRSWPVVQAIGREEWARKTLGDLKADLGRPFK